MANGKQTVAQAAVGIFMSGSLSDVRQILEIGQAIVAERERQGGGTMAVTATTTRRKPGPKPKVAGPTGPTLVPPPNNGPAPIDHPAASPGNPMALGTNQSATPRRRRMTRPAVVPAGGSDNPEQAPAAAAASATTGAGELPPQGEPGE